MGGSDTSALYLGIKDPSELDFESETFISDMELLLFGIHERITCLQEVFDDLAPDREPLLRRLGKYGYSQLGGQDDEPLILRLGCQDYTFYRPGEKMGEEDYDTILQTCVSWIQGHPAAFEIFEAVHRLNERYQEGADRLVWQAELLKSFGLPRRLDHVQIDVLLPHNQYLAVAVDLNGNQVEDPPEAQTLIFTAVHPTIESGLGLTSGNFVLNPEYAGLMIANRTLEFVNNFIAAGNIETLVRAGYVEFDEEGSGIYPLDYTLRETPVSFLKEKLYDMSPRVYNALFPCTLPQRPVLLERTREHIG